jgi:hypothetical protein
MPKIEVTTARDPNGSPSTKRVIKFWPKELSIRIVKQLHRAAGYPESGTYVFDWEGNRKDNA